jgi:hypothetical protein
MLMGRTRAGFHSLVRIAYHWSMASAGWRSPGSVTKDGELYGDGNFLSVWLLRSEFISEERNVVILHLVEYASIFLF